MPDSNEITLKDLFELLVEIKTGLSVITTYLSELTSENTTESETNVPDQFLNPETGLYDSQYYKSQHVKKDKDE